MSNPSQPKGQMRETFQGQGGFSKALVSAQAQHHQERLGPQIRPFEETFSAFTLLRETFFGQPAKATRSERL